MLGTALLGAIASSRTTSGNPVGPPDSLINLGVIDRGNNIFTLKWDFSTDSLFVNAKIVGWGSSTMHGSAADDAVLDGSGNIVTAYKLTDLLSVWVRDFVQNGTYTRLSMNGLYSAKFLPDENNTGNIDQFRNIDAVLALEPTIIILSLPSNDISQTATNQEFLDNLIAIDNECKERNIHLFVTTTQPRNNFTPAEQQRLFDAAILIKNYFGTRCIDIFTQLAKPYTVELPANIKDEYFGDSIHINNAGHMVVFNTAIATMTAYLFNRNYTKYILERSSTSPTTGFTVFRDDLTTFSVDIPRENELLYYYRIRAVRADLSFTNYSNTVSLQQLIYAGAVQQTIQINCAIVGEVAAIPGWNDFLPTDNIANDGEQMLNLVDSSNNPTTVGLIVVNNYPEFGATGMAIGSVYPAGVAHSYWRATQTSSVDLIPTNPRLKIVGLSPTNLYTVMIFPSRTGSQPDRLVAAQSQGKHDLQQATSSAGGNQTGHIILSGLKPSAIGEILIFVRGLGIGVVYQNAIIIVKHNNIHTFNFDAPIATAESNVFIVNGIPGAENIIKINVTAGGISSGDAEWNDVDLQAGVTFALNNSIAAPDPITIRANFIAAARQDADDTYLSTDVYPATVLRYTGYRTTAWNVTLGGLNPSDTHEILVMASSPYSGVNITRYTIGSTIRTITPLNNVNDATFSNIQSDSSGNVVIGLLNDSGAGTAYLTAIIVKRFVNNENIVFIAPIAQAESNVFNVVSNDPIDFDAPIAEADSNVFIVESLDAIFFDAPIAEADSNVFDVATNEAIDFDAPIAQAESNVFNVASPGGTSPATYTNGHPYYDGALDAWVLEPIGFNDVGNTSEYPMGIYFHGFGSGDTINEVNNSGYALRLAAGDRPPMLWICPQGPGINVWNTLRCMRAYNYMRVTYPGRIKLDQVYVSGHSLGGGACWNIIMNGTTYPAYGQNNTLFAAIMPVAPTASSGALTWSLLTNIAVMGVHGTNDGGATAPTQTTKIPQNMNPLPPRHPPIANLYWGVSHGGAQTSAYNRKNKTNSSGVVVGGTTDFDFIEWMLKFSTDLTTTAELHTTYAETPHNWGDQYVDYLDALRVVNTLGAGATKTSLLARLADLKTFLDGGGRRWLIDFGETAFQSTGFVNNMINHNTGQTISNLTTDTGAPSTIAFNIVNNMGTDTNGVNFNGYMAAPYNGFQTASFQDGMQIQLTTGASAITDGECRFTGLNDTKLYTVIIFHMSAVATFGVRSELQAVVNGNGKTQYSEFNSLKHLKYTGVTAPGGIITIATAAPFTRTSHIQIIMLYEAL